MEKHDGDEIVAKIDNYPDLKKIFEESVAIRKRLDKSVPERIAATEKQIRADADAEDIRFWTAALQELKKLKLVPEDCQIGDGAIYLCANHRLIAKNPKAKRPISSTAKVSPAVKSVVDDLLGLSSRGTSAGEIFSDPCINTPHDPTIIH